MPELSLARAIAVAVADVRTRLRRPSTGVLILVTAVGSYLAVPDPSTGSGLMRIGDARVLYTSPALAFASAVLVTMLLALFGFYLTSNALARDLRTRMGTVVAATPARNLEYLLGTVAGNATLLLAVVLGSMVAAMGMQVVRGEGPLQPLTFLAQYGLMLSPCIAWVAVIALVFECTPGLSGRIGDVLYFFVWSLTVALGAEPWREPGEPISWLGRCLDYSGLGYAIGEVQRIAGTSEFSIGYLPGEITKTTAFPGLELTRQAVATRALAFIMPALLLPVALVLFHRFDPARTRSLGVGNRRSLTAILAALSRAIGRPMLALLDRVSPDAALTFRARPPLVLVVVIAAVLGLTLPTAWVRQGLLPVLFAVLSAALADVATREQQAGMAGIVFAAPRRRDGFAAWKLTTAALVALLVAGVPAFRLLATEPRAGLSALVGVLFLATTSVAAGIVTGTPKTFLSLSLVLWYLALNAKGHSPALDYGGWWAAATPLTQAGWAAAAATAAVGCPGGAAYPHRARRVAAAELLTGRPLGRGHCCAPARRPQAARS